jgi:hypothetical protein
MAHSTLETIMKTKGRNHRMGALSLPDVSFQTDIAGRRWVYDEHHRQTG